MASEIQRYAPDLAYIGAGEYAAEMVEDDDGDCVDYADYLAAIAAKDANIDAERTLREAAEEQLRAVERRLEHTEEWYAERFERLSQMAREDLPETLRRRYFEIVANGNAHTGLDGEHVYEPPTYAQLLESTKWRAEKAERERDEARQERDFAMRDRTLEAKEIEATNATIFAEMRQKALDNAERARLASVRIVDLESQLAKAKVEREKFAGYVAGGLQRHPHDAELRAHIDAEAARTGEALQAMRERAEKAERERGPAITRADARELLEMSDLSTSGACYERVRAALREYAGADFECHVPNPLDAAIERAAKAERERDEARGRLRELAQDLREHCLGPNGGPKSAEEHVAEACARIADLESQLARAKAEGAREALERVEYELYGRTAMHVPERMETIRILRKMAARLAGEEPKL